MSGYVYTRKPTDDQHIQRVYISPASVEKPGSPRTSKFMQDGRALHKVLPKSFISRSYWSFFG